ncbi:hypothetical protein GJ744_003264 [Endocarpon pusillum]|uniref:PPIase cyclophilin-type domain-containing protein n=1 Tax=Endocarpon pusillum TaxID=364733 RepID=A0A8H7DZH3_9EURO|nr:hypothetical protein GJ744_003264 [Endocarpon pusillum]
MSSHYTTEPPPTASVLLHTTAGPIQISLFATQTPLASRNFLQHILDGYYTSTTFHRVVPGFVIQGGDPTGTGEGGESIYEDREFEIDARTGEKVVFGDEVHSRLKLNRRGLVGMAKMGESTYGSQFFITLADVRAQLDGKCTMFGRVEGEGIYNVVRIAEAENVEGTERPMYPFRITSAEVLEMPKGEPWASMKKRERVAKRTAPQDDEMEGKVQKKAKTKKKGKALLSFGDDEEGDTDTGPAIQPKAKFNTRLINGTASKQDGAADGQREPDSDKFQSETATQPSFNQPQDSYSKKTSSEITKPTRHRSSPNSSPHPPSKRSSKSPSTQRRKPSFHDPTTQLPLKDPESPSRSPTPSSPAPPSTPTTTLNAEIAALKASMRRNVPTASENTRKKSALEQLIPEKSIRGRKRPRPGDSGGTLGGNNDREALKMLNAFKARLEGIGRNEMEVKTSSKAKKDKGKTTSLNGNGVLDQQSADAMMKDGKDDDDDNKEAALCDLHFIANCLSCSHWDQNPSDAANHSDQHHPHSSASAGEDADLTGDTTDWMSHALSFDKDRLGKDLTWKRKNEEELVVIDPREKEKDLAGRKRRSGKGEREWGGRGK